MTCYDSDSMRDFEQLQVGKKAHALTLAVYEETGGFPSPNTSA